MMNSITFTNTFPQKALADIHDYCSTIKELTEAILIPAVNKLLSSIKRGGNLDSQAPIIIPHEKYQQLFDSAYAGSTS
jgi:hypothetical protein